MIIYKRFAAVLSLLAVFGLVLRSRDRLAPSRVWRGVPQAIGLGEWVADDNVVSSRPSSESSSNTNLNHAHPYPEEAGHTVEQEEEAQHVGERPGQLKPAGSNNTRAVVIGRLSSEDMTWLDKADLPSGIETYIYTVDESQSLLSSFTHSPPALHIPANKGHEAMVYLSYIIDHYDSLADITLFMHAHQRAWHNNELLNHDAVEMIKRLSAERVMREGYMNLRCHWKPGCPAWIRPGAVVSEVNREHPEEGAMAAAWSELFPDDPIPHVIGTACCAQFAVSRAQIRSISLAKFHHYRDFLLRTELPDATSGRVFEYLWHKIFTNQDSFCPDQRVCYCDGYGVCFESHTSFDHWFEMKYQRRQLQGQLDQWQAQAKLLEASRNAQGKLDEQEEIVIPDVNGDRRLQKELDVLIQQLEQQRQEAMEKGADPQIRAKIAGRIWKDGDGY